METIQIKRVYEPADKKDGLRILVDRLWPRGLKKETAGIDEWLKAVAPSNSLRKWFGHDPSKWQEFQAKYRSELQQNDRVKDLLELAKIKMTVTLLYAAHDQEHNQAIVLQQFLNELL